MAFAHGASEVVARLARAIGVTKPFSRLVLEMGVDSAVTVYVKYYAEADDLENLASEIEGLRIVPVDAVEVLPDTTVLAIPRA